MEITQRVRDNLTTLFLPPHDVLVPGANNDDPSDEHDIEYNRLCNEMIIARLRDIEKSNAIVDDARREELEKAELGAMLERPMIRTRYPKDDFDSEDVVSLDGEGNIEVLDAGSR